jgi:hypothetical protein
MDELVHDTEEAAVLCLHESVLRHLCQFMVDEVTADTVRFEHSCKVGRKAINGRRRRSERRQHRQQGSSFANDATCRLPEERSRVPRTQRGRRRFDRLHGRPADAIEEPPRSVQDEHDEKSRVTTRRRGRPSSDHGMCRPEIARATDRVAGADAGMHSEARRGDVTTLGETRRGSLKVLLSLSDIAANLSA